MRFTRRIRNIPNCHLRSPCNREEAAPIREPYHTATKTNFVPLLISNLFFFARCRVESDHAPRATLGHDSDPAGNKMPIRRPRWTIISVNKLQPLSRGNYALAAAI